MDDKDERDMRRYINLNFKTGSSVVTLVCTECWIRKPSNQFGDTSDVCNDCLDE